MNEETPVQARITRRFRAPAEAVFDSWLDPGLARQWFAPGLGPMTRIEIDARVGGTFRLVQRRGSGEAEHTGEYLEIRRPHRLVFTWRTPPLEQESRVIIEVVRNDDGCELTLVHEMNEQWADFVDRAAAAWLKMCDVIATLVERAPEAGAAL
jgi:uncharacterized protein YndB with AHSA1/START domain